jgi:hypothetical protein
MRQIQPAGPKRKSIEKLAAALLRDPQRPASANPANPYHPDLGIPPFLDRRAGTEVDHADVLEQSIERSVAPSMAQMPESTTAIYQRNQAAEGRVAWA